MNPQFIRTRIADRRDLLRLDHLQPHPTVDQAEHANRQVGSGCAFARSQLDHPLHQLQQLDAGVQPRLGSTVLNIENVAQLQQRAVAGPQGDLAQVGDNIGGGTALLKYLDRRFQQLCGGGVGIEQLLVVANGQLQVDSQLLEVVEQVEVGCGYAFPACEAKLHVASQGAEQAIEQHRLLRIHRSQRSANAQHGLWRQCLGRHRMGLQGGGQGSPATLGQDVDAGGKTGGDCVADIDPYRFVTGIVGGKRAQAIGTGLQVTATGHQGAARRVAVAGGGYAGDGRGLWAIARAHGRLACSFKRGHVGDALQLALLKVKTAAVDHYQHEKQGQGQCGNRHQADRATLPGSGRGNHGHSFAGQRPAIAALVTGV
ncbi:hypothetical protein D3C79_667690 [compost metagenome]